MTVDRKDWLERAVEELKIRFFAGVDVPDNMYVSYGFPSKTPRKTAGQCFYARNPGDEIVVLVSPTCPDGVEVLKTLLHELVHACLSAEAGHGPVFKQLFYAVGGAGAATKNGVTEAALDVFDDVLSLIGPYPNRQLQLGEASGEKKQKTYMLLLKCPGDYCMDGKGKTYQVRTTRAWIDRGVPECPVCEVPLELEEKSE